MRVHPDGTIEVSTPEEAVQVSRLLAAHNGEKQAPGKTGGAPAATMNRARRGAGRAADARPVVAAKGGPPTPRRTAKARTAEGGGVSAEGTKTCNRCHETKPVAEFRVEVRNRDGLHGECAGCNRARSREAYQKRKGEPVTSPAATKPSRLELLKERAAKKPERAILS